ncbi:MAG: DUF4134 family protein [Flavobacteriales bacterium]
MKHLKSLVTAILTLVFACNSIAQATNPTQKLTQGLDEGTGFIHGIFDSLSNLVLAISGVVALVSLGYIFYSFATNEKDISKKVMAWGGGSAFIFIAIATIKALFFGAQ